MENWTISLVGLCLEQDINSSKAKYAFVSTNSICQGLQVALLWKRIINNDVNINFAYKSFKWTNNAKYNAGVTCVIVGVCCDAKQKRYIYDKEQFREVTNISPLLMDGPTIFVSKSIFSPSHP